MDYNSLRNFLDDFKASHSCVDFLSSLGFNIPHEGAAILTPYQFRADDHNPSFAVYHSHAYDFGTHTLYDIFDLDMTLHHRSFLESVEALTGLRFQDNKSDLARKWQSERSSLQSNIQKWHELLLTNPVIHRIAQDRDEGALDYLLDRKLTLDYIKKETIGYNPEKQQIVFPYRKNGQIVYAVGRDFSGRAELPKDDPRRADTAKYQKFFITPGLDHCPWGLQTIRGMNTQRHMYRAADDELYEAPPTDDPKEDTLIICEGMVDASVFAQNGWQVISPVCGDFRKKQIPEVLDICRMFRTVFICFDNDGRGTLFQRNWAQRLFENGIPFICGHTAEAGAPKFDVADYYRAACNNHAPGQDEQSAGDAALLSLVENAIPGIVEISKSLYSYERISRFLEKSCRFVKTYDLLRLRQALSLRTRTVFDEHGTPHEVPLFSKKDLTFLFNAAMQTPPEEQISEEIIAHHTLTYSVDDAFYEFTGNCWVKKHDLFIRRYIYRALGRKAGDNKVGKVLKTMKTMLADTRPFDEKHLFTFTNGTLLLDEDDEAGNRGRLVKSSPEHRATISVGYRYIPGARNSDWEKFIHEVCCGNSELARELQKACGSILMADNSLHKMYYLIGDGRNGKSTLLSVIREVFGPSNGSNVRPDRLGEEFAPMAMKGKLYNICFEGGRYLKGAEENLKSIVAGEPIMAGHKGMDDITFIPRAKVFVAANNMFNARDVSEGFLSRFIFLPFTNKFDPGDPDLARKIKRNLAGVFNWCLEGYRMLMKEGFIECEIQKKYRRKFEEHIEPLRVFLRETFTGDFTRRPLGDKVLYSEYPSLKDLYACYKEWSTESGYRYTNRGIFTERMSFLAPKLQRGSGLSSLSTAEIDGVDCLIIPEMDSVILSCSDAGANNASHAQYALHRLQEQSIAASEGSDNHEVKDIPSGTQTCTGADIEEQDAPATGGEKLSGGPASRLLSNDNVRALIQRRESQVDTRNFIEHYWTADVQADRKDSGLRDDIPGPASWGIAILGRHPEASDKMPLRLVLEVYDALTDSATQCYRFRQFNAWLEEQEARVTAQITSWGMDLKDILQ